MSGRRKPLTISARVTGSEKLLLGAAAAMEGVTVSEAIHRVMLPWARERLSLSNAPDAIEAGAEVATPV